MSDWRWISKTTGEDKTTGMMVALCLAVIGPTALLPAVIFGLSGNEQLSLLFVAIAFLVAVNGLAYYMWGTVFCELVER